MQHQFGFGMRNGNGNGIPPCHPASHHHRHHRSLSSSQPSDHFVFSLDSLPPSLTPPLHSADMPRKPHRRSHSEVPAAKAESEDHDLLLFNEFMNFSGENNNSTGSSDNEADSNGGAPNHKSRHCRSASVDSFVMGSQAASCAEFSSAEIEKIMANEKLAEIALADPKRVKRILANRQSAARSKQRRVHYISELERRVQTLQTEATTLSAQLTLLQRDSAGISSLNNELRIRLQAMEQQAHLKDALSEALTAEVQRLKLARAEAGGAHLSSNSSQ